MANNEKGEEITSQGNEWEVVLLTASAYAAAPGPKQVELNDNDKGNLVAEDEGETSHALLMSGHFVVPPSQHENSPVESDGVEIQNTEGVEDEVPVLGADEGGRSDTKGEENWSIKGLAMPDEFPGIDFFEEKNNKLSSIHGTEFDEGAALQGLSLIDKEQSMYSEAQFSSFHSETTMGGSNTTDENKIIPGQTESSKVGPNSNISQLPKDAKEDKNDGSELPCEAWWKRRAASIYSQAKEANAVWSIFIAAAVVGLAILGQRWQQERWQALQHKWQFTIK
ncbi:ATG8-interacting protein 1-like [Actinidia eriantha]|uniref:ATG8-interacting protein 1-like n=1 Tax=Actinidia eriantha TaxID=165200 RepID=UPI0025845646|nr:ATG8-interacting protein 1-like [Actinidia eriantha]XP_057463595.1 ATG8-interacting protein 1-like [Actinidia eriantha]XP_057463596.1 ATG8-interacting protein 1-like [Actinidia eriantha]XP_057463597.1 ATG8-interacting protein 1-like [Actinidia eriantha]